MSVQHWFIIGAAIAIVTLLVVSFWFRTLAVAGVVGYLTGDWYWFLGLLVGIPVLCTIEERTGNPVPQPPAPRPPVPAPPVTAVALRSPVTAPVPAKPMPVPVRPLSVPVRPMPLLVRPTRVKGPKHDLIGLVGFHTKAFALVEPVGAYDHRLQAIIRELGTQAVGSGTDLAAGIHSGLDMLTRRPIDHIGRIWLLTDGCSTTGYERIDAAVARASDCRININTIGFGDQFDADRLRSIAAGTHRGRYVSVQSLRQLCDALLCDPRQSGPRNVRPETTVLVLDLSGSMTEAMEGRRKIDIVAEAMVRLLAFKQKLFSPM